MFVDKIFETLLQHFEIPFNLICSTTIFLKTLKFDILAPNQDQVEWLGFFVQTICDHIAAFSDSF